MNVTARSRWADFALCETAKCQIVENKPRSSAENGSAKWFGPRSARDGQNEQCSAKRAPNVGKLTGEAECAPNARNTVLEAKSSSNPEE